MPDLKCSCPHCDQEINVDTGYAGQVVSCPLCRGEFTVPEAPSEDAAPAPKQVTAAIPQQYAPASQTYAQAPTPSAQSAQTAYAAGAYAPAYPQGVPSGIGAVFADPLEAQPRVIAALGPAGTARWGWVFCGTWVVASWLFTWRMGSMLFSSLPGIGGPGGRPRMKNEIKLSDHIEWIASAAVPLAVLILVLLLLKLMAGKETPRWSILFTSGVVCVPLLAMGLFMMLLSFLEVKSPGAIKVLGHITVIFSVLVFTSLILLVKASLVSVIGYTRKAAFWLVPTVLLAVGYISSWIGELVGEISK